MLKSSHLFRKLQVGRQAIYIYIYIYYYIIKKGFSSLKFEHEHSRFAQTVGWNVKILFVRYILCDDSGMILFRSALRHFFFVSFLCYKNNLKCLIFVIFSSGFLNELAQISTGEEVLKLFEDFARNYYVFEIKEDLNENSYNQIFRWHLYLIKLLPSMRQIR